MNLLRRYLEEMIGNEVLVVTVDGRAFRGTLTEFDEEALILRDIIETSTREFKWRRPSIAVPSPSGGNQMVPLEEAVILLSGILRIWRL